MKQKLILPLLLLSLLLSMGNLQKRREALADRIAPSILRFHILANSDSKTDQAVKLEVRSFLLDYIRDHLPESADSKNEVSGWLFKNKTSLETAASRFLAEKQMPYSAALSLERTWFPTRVYDDLVIPCGTYDAARLILGKGKGHNWWCVLYPSLCFLDESHGIVSEEKKEDLREVLTEEEFLTILNDPEKRDQVKIGFKWF